MRQCRSSLLVLLVPMFTILAVAPAARGQVIRDDTLGAGRGAVVAPGPDYLITHELGELRAEGSHLLHSFREFDLAAGETATFTGPGSIERIIARITGGSVSTIDGTIRSSIPGSDLYFLNPAGILFGPNASLDIGGAFHANAGSSSVLGSDAPRPLDSSATLEIQGAQLFAPGGLYLSGADVRIVDSLLSAGDPGNARSPLEILASRRLDVHRSFAEAGSMAFRAPEIRLSASGLVLADTLDIASDWLLLDGGSRIETSPGALVPARYSIRSAQDLILTGESSISASGGSVRLEAPRVLLEQGSHVDFSTRSESASSAGSVEIRADRVDLRSGARIEGHSSGDAGVVRIAARDSIEISDPGSGIFVTAGTNGAGGLISLRAPRVQLRNNGGVSTSADPQLAGSQPGQVEIDGELVEVTGQAKVSSSSPNAGSVGGGVGSGAVGSGGVIQIRAGGGLLVGGGGQIVARTTSLSGGRIDVAALSVELARVTMRPSLGEVVTQGLIEPRDIALEEIAMLERCDVRDRDGTDSFRPHGREGIPETPRRAPAARYSAVAEPLGPADRGDLDAFLRDVALEDMRTAPPDQVLRTAEVLEARGELERARALLSAALAREPGRERARALALRGRLWARSAELELAERDLAEAERTAEERGAVDLLARILLDRARLDRELGRPDAARARLARSRESAERAGDAEIRALARAGLADLDIARGEIAAGGGALAEALDALAALPATHERLFAALHLGGALAALPGDAWRIRAGEALARAAEQAQDLGDAAAAAYAWAYLAELYAHEDRVDEASELARRAVAEALRSARPDAVHASTAQLGHALQAAGDLEGATRAYTLALRALERVRSEASLAPHVQAELATAFPGQQLSTDLVGVLLARAAQAPDAEARAALRLAAREQLEASSRRELRDYFQDECLAREELVSVTELPDALVVYPVMFADRAELLVSGPHGLEQIRVAASPARIRQEIEALRALVEDRTTHEYRAPASRLYTWLIEPLKPVLTAEGEGEADGGKRTLVFVPSGPFAGLPFAALYDVRRREFLIEQHPLALSPGFSLIEPRALAGRPRAVLQAALTEPVFDLPALASARDEVAEIRELAGGKTLLDSDFVASALDRELASAPYEIVHIASHARFGGDAGSTYLLTFDGRLGMSELADLVGRTRFRDRPLELLTLSACQTAAGDERAALGLAGVAMRAGARSTLASLWSVNDPATARLMRAFYFELVAGGASRSRALQAAQKSFLTDPVYRHPAYWAPFVLVGSWR